MKTQSDAMRTALTIASSIWESEIGGMRCVMVSLDRTEHNRRHLRIYCDNDGLYVRVGRRAITKRYLKNMGGARIVDAKSNLVVFHEII